MRWSAAHDSPSGIESCHASASVSTLTAAVCDAGGGTGDFWLSRRLSALPLWRSKTSPRRLAASIRAARLFTGGWFGGWFGGDGWFGDFTSTSPSRGLVGVAITGRASTVERRCRRSCGVSVLMSMSSAGRRSCGVAAFGGVASFCCSLSFFSSASRADRCRPSFCSSESAFARRASASFSSIDSFVDSRRSMFCGGW